ncbi:nucleoid occlusion factor SlmA [mine drainage metagenome]|uniref:Nucleoid occlusion factor SlmA n=1 Tax=mine drainage metagenome TaxID=410659 RepID=A0A1J5SKS8_9ZZZZ
MSPGSDQAIQSMRKKPRQARSWTTVRTLFEATLQILEQEGEARLTTNRVAERAGFSIGTLYQYFPDMDAVLQTMIDLERRRVMADLDALLDRAERDGTGLEAVLTAFIHIITEAFGRGNAARRLLLKRAWKLDHTPPVVAAKQQIAARILKFLQIRNDPRYPPPDPQRLFLATRSVLGALRAAVLEEAALPDDPGFEPLLVRLALGTLAATPPVL